MSQYQYHPVYLLLRANKSRWSARGNTCGSPPCLKSLSDGSVVNPNSSSVKIPDSWDTGLVPVECKSGYLFFVFKVS